MVIFSQQSVNAIFIGMEIIKTEMKLYQHENDKANGYTGAKAYNIDKSVRPLTDDTVEGCFKKIWYHSLGVTG
jgi:hypothetical protein